MRPLAQGVGLILTTVVGACGGARTSPSPAPLAATAGNYEIYNPTTCEAVAWTTDSIGKVHHVLAHIPSGERTVVRVAEMGKGWRIQANASAADGSDCQRGNYKIVIRRLES